MKDKPEKLKPCPFCGGEGEAMSKRLLSSWNNRQNNAQLTELKDLLQSLYVLQNGPPLIKYEKEYNEVMKRCLEVLDDNTEEEDV